MNFEEYWGRIECKFDDLIKYGFIYLPPISEIDLKEIDGEISNSMQGKVFKELNSKHKMFIDKILLDKCLAPKLFKLAKEKFEYKGSISNQYHVARMVTNENKKEGYRAHFDSHIFTLVMPINIPKSESESASIGGLMFFPKIRKFTNNEFVNFIGKLWFHRYASKKGLNKLSLKYTMHTNNFEDYRPLLFLGRSVFHANATISEKMSSHRLTLLAHYFDPSPKYGIGSLLRIIRNR
jgi:hypothetical protein